MFDEFLITKGITPYTDPFTPPVGPYNEEGTTEVIVNTGAQDTPAIAKKDDFLDLSAGDFCIDVAFDIRNIFQWINYTDGTPNYTTKNYIIAGQWDQNPDGTATDNANYWVLYFRVNADYSTDIVFKVVSEGVVVTQISHPVVLDLSGWTNGAKTNLSLIPIQVAVSRKGSADRIFVNGLYSNALPESAGSLVDFDTVIGDVQINGQIGAADDYQPTSITSVNNLRVFDYAYYWDDYVLDTIPWYQLGGLAFYPRMYPHIMLGNPGDIRSRIPIKFRMKQELDLTFNPNINAAFPFSLGMNGYLIPGELVDATFDLYIPMIAPPELEPFLSGYDSTESIGFDLSIPMIKFEAEGDVSVIGDFALSIPFLKFAATGIVSEIGVFDLKIPFLRVGLSGINGVTGSLDVTIPHMRAELFGSDEVFGSLDVTLPMMKISLQTLMGFTGILNAEIPMLRTKLSGFDSIEGSLDVTIPMLRLSFSSEADEEDFINMVMNIKNKAVTEYRNYNFNSFLNFNGKNIGVMPDGVYDLSGETDGDDEINWNFRTGYLELESTDKKRLKQAWFTYKSNGDLMLTVITPNGKRYEYQVESYSSKEYGSKIKIGKGIKSKYVMIDVANVEGSTIKLDAVRLQYDLLRKVNDR